MRRQTNDERMREKHAEDNRRNKVLRATQAWEKTPAGQSALATSAEFSAAWRAEWTAIEEARRMKVGVLVVTGGRTFCETHDVTGREVKGVDEAMAERRALAFALDILKPATIVHGGAHGADRWSGIWAERRNVPCVVEMADWSHGHRAGPERNQRMIDKHRPDAAVCFAGGSGTADCVKRLEVAGVPLYRVAVRVDQEWPEFVKAAPSATK